MRSSELYQGRHYEIVYQENLPLGTFSPKGQKMVGFGMLMKLNCRPGWHSFKLSTGQIVYASSRSVLRHRPPGLQKLTSLQAVETIIDDDVVDAEVRRLRKLGVDDHERRDQVMEIVTYLNGLGVAAKSDAECTSVSIPYLGIIQLKAVLASVYENALSID